MKYLSKIIYILVFLVMVTSPYAGHTYAEYARQATGSDMARITKFGATVTATSNAFAVSYMGIDEYADDVVVLADENVFAPGTHGVFCEYGASGQPEVRIRVVKTANITMNDYWTNGDGTSGSFYCPIVFDFGSAVVNGLDHSSKESLISALKTEFERGNGYYAPNFNLSGGSAADLNRTVTWYWPYQGATGSEMSQTEPNDTALGDKGANMPTLAIDFEIRVEQVD